MKTDLIKTTSSNDMEFDFAGELIRWIEQTSIDHVVLNFHEGFHILAARRCCYEPKVYGPSYEPFYRAGVRWTGTLGSVETLPDRIRMTAPPLSVATFFLGPRYVEEKMLGKEMTDSIWHSSRCDLDSYNRWRSLRQKVVGDVEFLRAEDVRKSVFRDFERPEFRKLLLVTAREYERRVSKLPDCKIK